ncbi:cation:proton antiporter [Lacihabitans lacunae]|uniref:Cation:proton antiporter n=1 Tax=Lacihabitans lacunae TaxID=1028214 RepID=A0ABV7YYX1_9BACT
MNLELAQFELPFFTNLLILLVTARLFGELFERFKQPAMIGEIVAGIVLGPSVLNLVHRTHDIEVISELGVFMLVIIAGLEINIDEILKSFKGKNIFISFSAFFIPVLSGIWLGVVFKQDLMTTAFISLCVAITALPVSIRILMDLGKLNTEVGQKIISVAIFDDVLALSILGVLLNLKNTDLSFGAVAEVASISILKLLLFIAILSASYFVLQKITNKGNYVELYLDKILSVIRGKESLFALFFIFILLFSTITETLGFHFIIGAFFAAMLISEKVVGSVHLKTVEKTTSSLAMGFLAPIFFAGIGLEFNFSAIQNYSLLAGILAVSYFSKILGGLFGGYLAGLENRISLILGIGLNARGIMELVIVNIAFKAGYINAEIFSILIVMGVLTTLTTPIMLKWSFNRFKI